MIGTTHQMIALVTALWILSAYPVSAGLTVGIMAIIAVMVGALTPDLDQPTANIWRRLIGGNVVGNIFSTFSGGHRHMTHSLVGVFAIGYFLNWVIHNIIAEAYISQATIILTAFMIGYISHPIADSFTDMGVPWFWPLHFKVKLPPGPEEVRVTTNSFVERVIVRSSIVIIAVLLLQTHWQVLQRFFINQS